MLTIDQLKADTESPVIIIDETGVIIHINQTFEKTWGWQKEALIGQTLATILPETLKDAHHMGFARFLVTGKPTILNQAINLTIMKADGKEAAAEHIMIAEKIDANWIFGATIKPLEEAEKKF